MRRALPDAQRSGESPVDDRESPAPTSQLIVVFIGLGLGTLIAGLNMTLVATGMPRIVADIGGVDLYSWIAIGAVLTSTISGPIAGKLSDLYGRKPFFLGGILTYIVASTVCGLAPNADVLVLGRLLQGVGMGAMGPLAQAIIGDIVSARERGKYQGIMSGLSGAAIIAGPALGGFVTDHFSWRMLFFLNLPFALAAIAIVGTSLHVAQRRRRHVIDYLGIVLLSSALVCMLLAIQLGAANTLTSTEVAGLYAAAALLTVAFAFVELRAPEPLLPPALWRNSIVVWANVASLAAGMVSFGSVYFIPVFAQGVLGVPPTVAGNLLVPLLAANVVTSIVNGLMVAKTGRYKPQLVAGGLSMVVGFVLMAQMDVHSSTLDLVGSVILLGIGLGVFVQTLVLVAQNAVTPADLGVATSAISLFRSIGSAAGVSIMGAVLTPTLGEAVARHLAGSPASAPAAALMARLGTGAAFDLQLLGSLSPEAVAAIHAAMAESLHAVFVAGAAFALVALIAALAIREDPLRRTVAVRLQRNG